MTNLDKAAELILPYIGGCTECDRIGDACLDCTREAKDAVKDIAEAGLLAPELPDESWPQVWELNGFLVTAIEDGGETIGLAEHEGDGNEGFGWFMDKHLARKLALAVLAAAQYAKEEEHG